MCPELSEPRSWASRGPHTRPEAEGRAPPLLHASDLSQPLKDLVPAVGPGDETPSWALEPHTWTLGKAESRCCGPSAMLVGGSMGHASVPGEGCWGLGPEGGLSTQLLWTPSALGHRECRDLDLSLRGP